MKKPGYQTTFIGKNLEVKLPVLPTGKKKDLVKPEGSREALLHYVHHSVALSKSRRLPWFAAVNIDGSKFRKVLRNKLFSGGSDKWSVDDRAKEFQLGDELYGAPDSHFDRGHLVKREDPQWGDDDDSAADAARSTFFFANCAPQVGDLNRKEWRVLEDYILKKESTAQQLKIAVFTGPVLSEHDPVFIHPIKGANIQLPVLFWKLVYFTSDGKTLNRVAFLMGQKQMLLDQKIAKPKEEELETFIPPPFSDYEDAATFQVNVSTIERLTGLKFSPAHEPYKDERGIKIILKQVDLGGELEGFQPGGEEEFELVGLVL